MDDIAGFHEKELDGLTQELLDEKASLIEEYHVGFSVSGKLPEGLTIDIGRAVEAVRIIPAQDKTEIERIKSLSSYYYTSDKINENSEDYYVLAQELLLESDYPNSQNRLIISVNLDRTKEEIEEEIKNLLKIHMHNREKRKRLTKWKYYIVAYDIKNENGNISYDKIVDNLQRLFPDADTSFDARNAENYYKNALHLINGGYKEYVIPSRLKSEKL